VFRLGVRAKDVSGSVAGRQQRRLVGSGLASLLLLGSAGTAVAEDRAAAGDGDGEGDGESDRIGPAEVGNGEYEACEADFGTGKVVVVYDDPEFDPEDVDDLAVVAEGEAASDCPPIEPNPGQDWDGPWDLDEFESNITSDHGIDDLDINPPDDGPYIYSAIFEFRSDADYRVETTWRADPGEAPLELAEAFEACDAGMFRRDEAQQACFETIVNDEIVVFAVPEPDEPQEPQEPEEPVLGPACPEGQVPAAGFVDVVPTSVHAPAIDCIASYGITVGVSATTYEPGGTVTRAQKASFVARLLRAAGAELPDVDMEAFDDIAGSTHAVAISQLAELGIVEGRGSGVFLPSSPVTRAQSASMIVRALDLVLEEPLSTPDQGPFVDTAGSTHETAIDRAAEAGIVRGTTPTTFEPNADNRRDQMASMLARTLEVLATEGHVQPPGS
jgi:hypothetical protein